MLHTLYKALVFVYNYKDIFNLFVPKSKKPVSQELTFNERAVAIYNGIVAEYNAPEVELSFILTEIAKSHAEWMEQNKKISHVGANGLTCKNRAVNAGYDGSHISEHLFICTNCNEVGSINCLMTTIAARGDISENFRHIGIGNSGKYWCIVLGR